MSNKPSLKTILLAESASRRSASSIRRPGGGQLTRYPASPHERRQCDAPDNSTLPSTGLLRLSAILGPNGPIPVSKSTWWAGVKSGRFPQPVHLGPRTTAWRVEDIRALIEHGISGKDAA
jgi:predicted DNA-binding transcriptional regulator AlpA